MKHQPVLFKCLVVATCFLSARNSRSQQISSGTPSAGSLSGQDGSGDAGQDATYEDSTSYIFELPPGASEGVPNTHAEGGTGNGCTTSLCCAVDDSHIPILHRLNLRHCKRQIMYSCNFYHCSPGH